MTSRARKERFILTFGKPHGASGNDGVSSILWDYGLEAFEEWAIDLIVEDLIRSARSAIKRKRQNREAYAAFARRSEQAASLSASQKENA